MNGCMKMSKLTRQETIERIVSREVQYKNHYELMNLYCEHRAEELKEYTDEELQDELGWEEEDE